MSNTQSAKAELMIYLGVAPGNLDNYLFMRLPNNVLFTSTQAIFDERLFPRDKESMAQRYKPAELPVPRRKKTSQNRLPISRRCLTALA